ncbi:MAG: NlpC/P60 family protein [Oscillospiraceae bacterium]
MEILSAGKTLKQLLAACCAAAVVCAVFIGPAQECAQPVLVSQATDLDDSIADYQQQLNDIQNQKDALDAKISDTENDLAKEQENQDYLTQRIQLTEDSMTILNQQVIDLEDRIADLDTKISDNEASIDTQKENINKKLDEFRLRLRTMYVAGQDSYADIVLGASDFYDVLMRLELVKRVTGHDEELITGLIDMKKQLEATQVLLDDQKTEVAAAMADYTTQLGTLNDQQDELEGLYAKSLDNQERLGQLSEEYADQQSDLNDDEEDISGTLTDLKAKRAREKAEEAARKAREAAAEAARKRAEAQAQQNGGSGSTTPDKDYSNEVNPTGGVETVIEYAKTMVGGAYVWAAATQRASDCSGLTMLCYSQIGIYLPHKASLQVNYGRSVSFDEMQPGDLIFYGYGSYSSVYHVSLYIGNGKIIHAADYSVGIIVSNATMSYNNIVAIKRLVD